MNYSKLKNTWIKPQRYELSAKKILVEEEYTPRVTLSMPEWRRYLASGNSVLLGAGGVIPGGTLNTGWAGNGSVYAGNVNQGYGMYGNYGGIGLGGGSNCGGMLGC